MGVISRRFPRAGPGTGTTKNAFPLHCRLPDPFRPPSRTSRDCDILIGASVLKCARGLEAIEDWVYRLK